MNADFVEREVYGILCKNQQNEDVHRCNKCAAEYPDFTALKVHNYNDHGLMTSLSRELIEKIFDYLPPNDLAAMSLTCRKYKKWTEDYFGRNRKCGMVILHENNPVNFLQPVVEERGIYKHERYEARFTSSIRNVKVLFHFERNRTEIFHYIKKNCAKELLSLTLNSFFPEITNESVQIIAGQLEHLETLVLSNVNLYGGINNLPELKNLKYLQICNCEYRDRSVWLCQKFPNLRVLFVYNIEGTPNPFGFFRFHGINRQLKTIGVRNLSASDSISSINFPLQNLVLECIRRQKFPLGFLRKCCCRRIELILRFDLTKRIAQKLSGLDNIKSLHIPFSESFFSHRMDSLRSIGRCVYLTKLCLKDFNHLTEQELNIIAECFPNLSELRIKVKYQRPGSMSLEHIINFIRSRLLKLKYLYYDDVKRWLNYKLVTKFKSGARLKLNDSNHLIVYSSDESLETLEIFAPEQYNFEARLDCILCDDDYRINLENHEKANYLENLWD